MKRGMRRALAGLGLAALSVPVGIAPFAAEAVSAAGSAKAEAAKAPAAGELPGDAAAADLGGAIYSPFSPAAGAPAARPAAQGRAALPPRGEARVGLVATTLSAVIAAGLLFVLVRLLLP